MKNKLLTIFLINCILQSLVAQTYVSMRPNWTFNVPPAENSTYEYYVSKGVGNTEKDARKDAFVIVVKEAQSRIGVAANSAEIFNAFQTSDKDFNVIANDYNIPMKEVCSFSEQSRDGKWYYYQLIQIAIRGNIVPDFRPFAGDCYDFSKAIEVRKILNDEYKDILEARKKAEQDSIERYIRIQKQNELEEYQEYNISYSEFCHSYWNLNINKPAIKNYLGESEDIYHAGNYLWIITCLTAGISTMCTVLNYNVEKDLYAPVILGSTAAASIPSLLCYSFASAYRRKAWKLYRKPYDDALKAQQKQYATTFKLSPIVSTDWVGVNVRLTFN